MRILFVSVNKEKEPYPVSPLGIAYLSSVLKENAHTVRVLDLCFSKNPFKDISNEIHDFQPELIGLSIRNIDNLTYKRSVFYFPWIKEVVMAIKNLTTAPVVVGGSGFSLFPERLLKELGVDYGIVGEGELAFLKLIALLKGMCNIHDVPGLCYISNNSVVVNPRSHSRFVFKTDRSILNNQLYYREGGMANIQSKRGCPFNCSYCTYPMIDGKRLRLRPPEDVVDEMERIYKDFKIEHIFFVDDIFNVPREHAEAICEELIKRKIPVKWYCFSNPSGMDADLAFLMKKANCEGVEFGTDSGSMDVLRLLKKNFTSEDIERASAACKKARLPDAHYLLLGAPGESPDTIKETVKLYDSIKPRAVIAMTGIRIYPNTELLKIAREESVLDKTDIFRPVFYISPQIGAKKLLELTENIAGQRKNWVVPSLKIRCDINMMSFLRKKGMKGPLWDML